MAPLLIPLLIIVLLGFFIMRYVANGRKKSTAILELMESKITAFKSKNFASTEERERAKSELKAELLKMKDEIRNVGSLEATLALREKALSKIIEL